MKTPSNKQLLDVCVEAARAAGGHALKNAHRRGEIAQSFDHDVKLVMDSECQRVAEGIIHQHFPDHAILGEEGSIAKEHAFEWIVDPIDGTKSFIRGVPLYATLVACRREGRGVLGVIAIPALDEMGYAVAGGGAWHVRAGGPPAAASVSPVASLGESLLCSSDFTAFTRRQDAAAGEAARTRLESACRLSRTWGDGYGYLLVATGRAELMVDPLMNPWDAAAVETVIHEAGGTFSSWQGEPRIDAGDGVATNGCLHPAVLALLAGPG